MKLIKRALGVADIRVWAWVLCAMLLAGVAAALLTPLAARAQENVVGVALQTFAEENLDAVEPSIQQNGRDGCRWMGTSPKAGRVRLCRTQDSAKFVDEKRISRFDGVSPSRF